MKPMSDKILVIKEDENKEQISKGGIILGKSKETDKTPARGKVVEVADNISDLSVGDTVVFGKYAGIPVVLDETTTVFVLDKSEVLMIL